MDNSRLTSVHYARGEDGRVFQFMKSVHQEVGQRFKRLTQQAWKNIAGCEVDLLTKDEYERYIRGAVLAPRTAPAHDSIAKPVAAEHRPAPARQESATAPAAAATNSVGAAGAAASGKDFIACAAFAGSTPGYVFKKGDQGLGYYKDTAPGAKVAVAGGGEEEGDIKIIMDRTGVGRARAVAALKEHKDAAGAILAIEDAKDAKPAAAAASASGAAAGAEEKPPPSAAEKLKAAHCMEAEDHKTKGNMAFKAGKYRCIMLVLVGLFCLIIGLFCLIIGLF